MSLIRCVECGANISSKAKQCPKCGAPVPQKTSILTWIAASVFALSIYSCVAKKEVVSSTSKVSSPAVDAAVVNCNKAAAVKMKELMVGLGATADLDSKLEFHWSPPVLDQTNDDKAEAIMRSMADADACVLGRAREIRFYRRGNLWAVASPTSGFMMMK